MVIDTIIASGDSFVAGVELDANSLIPGYTNNCFSSHARLPKEAEILNQQYVNLRNLLSVNQQAEHVLNCKKKAWPEKLKKFLDVDVINIADGGICNQEIVHRTLTQVENCIAQGKNPQNILVCLMLTHGFRFGHPQRDQLLSHTWKFQSVYHNDNELTKKTLRSSYIKYLLEIHNDYDWIWQSYIWIEGAIKYLRTIGVTIYVFDCSLWSWTAQNINYNNLNNNERSKIKNIFKMINNEIRLNMGDHAYKKEKLPGGHYTETVHVWFAQEVVKLIKKDLNL
jgi:hypothetical protein